MFRVRWADVRPFIEGDEVKSPRSLQLTPNRNIAALLKTGAKLYGARQGAVVAFWVSGYASDFSDIPEILRSRPEALMAGGSMCERNINKANEQGP